MSLTFLAFLQYMSYVLLALAVFVVSFEIVDFFKKLFSKTDNNRYFLIAYTCQNDSYKGNGYITCSVEGGYPPNWNLKNNAASLIPEEAGITPEDIVGPPMMLSEMKKGQQGIIRKVSGESILRRRLLEMGINRGSIIYVEKYAPLKDPIEIVVKGYHLSLRVGEAANILVENVKFKNK